jgi:peptide/nickel transport system permease protein
MTEHRSEPPGRATLAVGPAPAESGPGVGVAGALPGEPTALVYDTGLELKARSQWWYARHRFFRHRLAMLSIIALIIIFGAGILANFVAPYSYSDISIDAITRCAGACHPTIDGKHFFGTDQVGRDYFSRVIWGIRTTERVALLVGFLSTVIGTVIGGIAGYIAVWAAALAIWRHLLRAEAKAVLARVARRAETNGN